MTRVELRRKETLISEREREGEREILFVEEQAKKQQAIQTKLVNFISIIE